LKKDILQQIAFSNFEGVGPVTGKKILDYFGNIENVFSASVRDFSQVERVGETLARKLYRQLNDAGHLKQAELEVTFIEKNNITPIFYTDQCYPSRLKYCSDSPLMVYKKGKVDLNHTKSIGIVGTRNATSYGKEFCNQLVRDLTQHGVLVVSGLAYGIDICAHQAAMENGLPTLGVLAHGLDRVYPAEHRAVASKMQENGGLLTEYMSKTKPDRENFPMRNRIVAGLCDAIVVVESAAKGGSLITAEIANSYNRDVFALPGKVGSSSSNGCNKLIKSNKAALIESYKDIEYVMGWQREKDRPKQVQKKLFVHLSKEESMLVGLIQTEEKINVDELALKAQIPVSKLSVLLLNLEFNGIVKALPGKFYSLN